MEVTITLKNVEEVHETERAWLILLEDGSIVAIPKVDGVEILGVDKRP